MPHVATNVQLLIRTISKYVRKNSLNNVILLKLAHTKVKFKFLVTQEMTFIGIVVIHIRHFRPNTVVSYGYWIPAKGCTFNMRFA